MTDVRALARLCCGCSSDQRQFVMRGIAVIHTPYKTIETHSHTWKLLLIKTDYSPLDAIRLSPIGT